LTAFWLVTLKTLRLRDVALAACALGLAIAAKSLCLLPVSILSTLLLLRVILLRKSFRAKHAVPIAIGGALFIVGMASVTYLRNYLNFHNPFWPELQTDIDRLNIHWPGRVPYRLPTQPPPHPEAQIDENLPWGKFLEYFFAVPGSVTEFQYGDVSNYGIGVAWIVFPLAIVSALVLAFSYARSRLGMDGRARLGSDERLYALFAFLLAAFLFYMTPARWAPRYHIATVALLMTVISALSARPGWQRLGESASAAVLVCSLMNFWWATPKYWCTWSDLKTLAPLSIDEREFATHRTPWISTEFGRLREELHDGDLLVVRHYGLPGHMWNNSYSNRVEYVLDGPSLYDYANDRRAKCAVVAQTDPDMPKFRADTQHWKEAAQVNRQHRDYFAFKAIQ
jgi:hypothetical protein